MPTPDELSEELVARIEARNRTKLDYAQKMACDWLGREYEIRYTREIDGVTEWMPVRLTRVDQARLMCSLTPIWQATPNSAFAIGTEEFRSGLDSGIIRERG